LQSVSSVVWSVSPGLQRRRIRKNETPPRRMKPPNLRHAGAILPGARVNWLRNLEISPRAPY
jgi:hypothetical protein